MTKRLTTQEFIVKANNIHKKIYDYSLVNYINCKVKIKIICKLHGIFEQSSNEHLYGGCGCPICGGKLKSNTDDFIIKSKKVHGNKFNYSDVNYVNSSTNVEIICLQHGVFKQTPINHLSGAGCND